MKYLLSSTLAVANHTVLVTMSLGNNFEKTKRDSSLKNVEDIMRLFIHLYVVLFYYNLNVLLNFLYTVENINKALKSFQHC